MNVMMKDHIEGGKYNEMRCGEKRAGIPFFFVVLKMSCGWIGLFNIAVPEKRIFFVSSMVVLMAA